MEWAGEQRFKYKSRGVWPGKSPSRHRLPGLGHPREGYHVKVDSRNNCVIDTMNARSPSREGKRTGRDA